MSRAHSRRRGGLVWPSLLEGRLIKRYKRFLADVELADDRVVTAHCPNSGRMTGCSEAGRPVFLSQHDNPRRKLKYTWELIGMPTSLVGVNTLVPNRLVAQAVRDGDIALLSEYDTVTTEVKINAHSRLDLKLSHPNRRPCYIEIKNCTLVDKGVARFPDARTVRGRKHLRELAQLRQNGARTVMFFVVQRSDAYRFTPADAIDPEYGQTLRQVAAEGVEIIVYDVTIDLSGIALNKQLPYQL